MSYKVSYLVPKHEFERLTQGEWGSSKHEERKEKTKNEKPKKVVRLREKLRKMIKVPRSATSTENKKQKVSNGRKKKPKKVVRLREKLRKMIKVPRSTKPRERSAEETVHAPIKKRKLTSQGNPWSWDEESSQKLDAAPALPEKPPDVGKFFDDSPKRKTKVMRLMKFIEKNKNHVMVNDDYEILVNNELIPGSDFIDIMNYLKSKPKERALAFHPTLNPKTNLPLGTKRFVDALHEAIEGERILGDLTDGEMNAFAKKLSNFAGLELGGLRHVVGEIAGERGRLVDEVRVENRAAELQREHDEERVEEEQERARNILKDIEEEERKVKQRKARDESDRTSFLNRQRKKKRQFNLLRRIKDDTELDVVEARDLPDIEEEEKKLDQKRRRQILRNLKTVEERINEELKKANAEPGNLASRTTDDFTLMTLRSPKAARESYNVDRLGKLWTLTKRRAKEHKVPVEKEQILLEEESRRRPTVGEVLAKADLGHFFDEEAAAAEEEEESEEEEEEGEEEVD